MSNRKKCAPVAVTALLLVAACGGGDDSGADATASQEGGSGEIVEMEVMMLPAQSSRVPVQVAIDNGFFEEAGVNVTIVDQPTGVQAMQAMGAIGAEAALLAVPTATQGVQAGLPGQFFCGMISVLQTSFLAAADSDLPAMSDGDSWEDVVSAWNGLNVGIQVPLGTGFHLLTEAGIAAGGGDSVTYVTVGPDPAVAEASLGNGTVDVVQANPTATQRLLDSGAKELIYMPEGPDQFGSWYGSAWTAPQEWLEDNPEAASAFCEGMQQGIDFVNDPANEAEVQQSVVDVTGVSPEVAETVVPTYVDFNSELPEDVLTDTFEGYRDLGIIQDEPPITVETMVASLQN